MFRHVGLPAEVTARRRQLVEMIGAGSNRRRQARRPQLQRDLDDTIGGSAVWPATEDLLASAPAVRERRLTAPVRRYGPYSGSPARRRPSANRAASSASLNGRKATIVRTTSMCAPQVPASRARIASMSAARPPR